MTDQLRDQIAALFPERMFMAHRDNIAAAVVEVVAPLLAERDEQIRSLDDRRARWAEEHQKRLDELAASEASRRDWAAEALRLEHRLEQVREDRQRRIEKGNRLRSALVAACGYDEDPDEYPGDEALIEALGSRPVCAVHPEGGSVPPASDGQIPGQLALFDIPKEES